jgi:hypothetical protein
MVAILGTIRDYNYTIFTNLLNHVQFYGTEQQWRFYFSLISLLIFSGIMFSLVIVLIIRWGIFILNKHIHLNPQK